MKIIADENIPYLRGRLEGEAEVIYADQNSFTPELVRDADALLIRTRTRCDQRLLEDSNVRLVATATIGMDQIDTDWCAANGITVRNSPGCNAPAVTQYVWSSLLRCGFNPATDQLGIVGCGNVGSIVRQWALQLGTRVLISDPPRQKAGLPGEYAPLERLLAECDAVTLHTPLTRVGACPTYHLIGEREISLLRDGKLLINAARGPVVDFTVLKPEVLSGRIRAVIDTWEGEPAVDTELLDAVQYGTFHIAGYSRQGKQRATRMVLEAVRDTFGLNPDISGLEPDYRGNPDLTAKAILDSYDPMTDTVALRHNPAAFEQLRHDYDYRNEL